MNIIQRLESGYLQLLRIIFLLVATIFIAAASVLVVRYLVQHDAEPVSVSDEVKLSLSSYKPIQEPPTSVGADGELLPKAAAAQKDPLFEELVAVLTRTGKKAQPHFTINLDPVKSIFGEFERDSQLGRPFIKQLIGILEAAHNKPEILARLKKDFGPELGALIDHSRLDYKKQIADIEMKRQRAAIAAQEKQSQAMWSLYAAGVLFLAFVGLVLLIVLLKIERNLRGQIPIESPLSP